MASSSSSTAESPLLQCPNCMAVDLDDLLHGNEPPANWKHTKRFGSSVQLFPELKETTPPHCLTCRFLLQLCGHLGNDRPTHFKVRLRFPDSKGIIENRMITVQDVSGGRGTEVIHLLPVLEENHGTDVVSGRLIGPEVVYDDLVEWIEECRLNHSDQGCGQLEGHPDEIPGLRLIDCETRHVVPGSKGVKFVALSYVWGQGSGPPDPPSSTGALPGSVPNTINDAMEVTKRLGLRYLWADQFCIDQKRLEHKMQQIALMDMIYSLAFITIIAACGDSSVYGLPGVHPNRPRQAQPSLQFRNTLWVSGLRDSNNLIHDSKWFTRGWTYQEGVFSRRRLIFTDDQVVFECNTSQCREAWAGKLFIKDRQLMFGRGLYQKDHHLKATTPLDQHIKSYSNKDLTFGGDGFNALAGVFRAFSQFRPLPKYQIFGIPVDTSLYYLKNKQDDLWLPETADGGGSTDGLDHVFAQALCWELNSGSAERRDGFPTWSWLSWKSLLSDNWIFKPFNNNSMANVKFYFQKMQEADNCKFERLTEKVVQSMNRFDGKPIPYTGRLRIEGAYLAKVIVSFAPDSSSGGRRKEFIMFADKWSGKKDDDSRPSWRVEIYPSELDEELEKLFQSSSSPSSDTGSLMCLMFAKRFDELVYPKLIIWNKPGKTAAQRIGHVEDYKAEHEYNIYDCFSFSTDGIIELE
ncbi:heterokaryon incompatibility protein-domain-containing protein [Podospora fimiseda]|uniref:Heterokaryon incompatibility protein-domain-containing protein n=1 Tax=Podospora fimiseda TaxID=252190 RepID=A0AAN7BSL3_9PEZI|nr:heterokaryon incompatibility protein-domain-containing protein [Podospora fimiseda]